jgi:putative endonuclease
MKYWLYILSSQSSGKYFIGISENPQRRLLYHNSIEKGFTSRCRPLEIVFTKEYPARKKGINHHK